jgi:hypothetical protein
MTVAQVSLETNGMLRGGRQSLQTEGVRVHAQLVTLQHKLHLVGGPGSSGHQRQILHAERALRLASEVPKLGDIDAPMGALRRPKHDSVVPKGIGDGQRALCHLAHYSLV